MHRSRGTARSHDRSRTPGLVRRCLPLLVALLALVTVASALALRPSPASSADDLTSSAAVSRQAATPTGSLPAGTPTVPGSPATSTGTPEVGVQPLPTTSAPAPAAPAAPATAASAAATSTVPAPGTSTATSAVPTPPAATAAAPSATPSPAPAPAPATGGTGPGGTPGAALSWAPPAGYAQYPLRTVTATKTLTVIDAKGGDVRLELSPTGAVGPVTIQNCRNAVLIGGRIRVLPTSQVGGNDQRALYVKNCTGTVHIEGVEIDGDVQGSEADAIAVNSPQALLQIENVRAMGLRGGYNSNHADVFQPWGGVREFRIDRLTGTSNYQGLTLSESPGEIGRGTIRNVNIAGSDAGTVDRGGYLFWIRCTDGYPLTLESVHVAGRSGRVLARSVWPQPEDASCPATIRNGTATWPTVPTVTGGVQEGAPAAGDFVPAGSVGLGYSSPGYR